MLAVLVMATALSRIAVVPAKPCSEGYGLDDCSITKFIYNEEEYAPDIEEQLRFGHGNGFRWRRKQDLPTSKREVKALEEDHKNGTMQDEGLADEVDREDHFTQHLPDLLVNTDSEITGVQATDIDENNDDPGGREDGYLAFLEEQRALSEDI